MKIMVSACLTGENCKYNGGNNRNEKVLLLMENNEVITICPEQMGGLPTPRVPSEIKDGVVTAKDGWIVDKEFRTGAAKCLEIALIEKPTFRDDWARHRCIVPASWYFEWEHLVGNDGKKHTGDKYMIQPKDSTMTWLCGLYRIEDGMPVFVVLTREPGEEIRFIHDRMPLIMPDRLVNEWIRPDVKPEDLLPYALTDMIFEKGM